MKLAIMAKNIEEILNCFQIEDVLRMILEMKTLMIRYLSEYDVMNSELYYSSSLFLDHLHELILEKILNQCKQR